MSVFLTLASQNKGKFMAYKPNFLEINYDYILSLKMIIFHFLIIALATTGLVFSLRFYPKQYGRS